MNEDIIKGKWKQLKGEVRNRWGKLTDDTIDQIDGNREKLVGAIQESYGLARKEAEEQLNEWQDSWEKSKNRAA